MPPKKKIALPSVAEPATAPSKPAAKSKQSKTISSKQTPTVEKEPKKEIKAESSSTASSGSKRSKAQQSAPVIKDEVGLESDESDSESDSDNTNQMNDSSNGDHPSKPASRSQSSSKTTSTTVAQAEINRPDPTKVGTSTGPETTISSVMASQRRPKMQSKLDELGDIELEYDMADIDQLANHFGDIFVSLVYDQQSEQITQLLSKVNEDQNSIKSVLQEYNPNYHKQTFIGFNAGKQDLETAMSLEKNQEEEVDLAINSTFFSTKSTKDHSKSIDDIVDKIDLVAEHFGNRYENEVAVKAKIAKKREAKTAGKMWYDLPKTKMTKEAIQTWAILQNKGQLTDAYISVEKSKMPEYSQMGYFVGSGSLESGGLTKREKKQSLADQFLEEMKQTSSVKRRFKEYHAKKQSEWGTGTQYSGVKRKYTGKK